MPPLQGNANPEDIDVRALGRALWRAKTWVLGLTILAGIATFVGLTMVRPLYTSEARILIENDVSPFTRAAGEQGRDQVQVLDEQAVQSQVQVLTSRDLALEVVQSLDLVHNQQFAQDAGVSVFKRLLNSLGLGRGTDKSEQEKAADAFIEHLSVYVLNKSSVIAVDYTSGDPELAAKAANALADAYIEWQRKAKIDQTKDATNWLSSQIDELRKRTSDSEAAVEQFRASNGLYEGSNNVTLGAQQLSELNSQLILAKAQQSEAEARARLIKQMLAGNGDIDATPEVLKSELISRLVEQRVQVQRQLAELSATLLPSHPRIKQLNSELADVRTQIRDEATKIVKSLENEAEVAKAREISLRNSLNEAKTQSAGQGDAEIKLRALEREAKANRDLLESYLARYQDASGRHEMGAVPANATIVSRAHDSTTPSFPKRGQISALVMAAIALLSFAYVLAREMIGGPKTMPLQEKRAEPSPLRSREDEPLPTYAAPERRSQYSPPGTENFDQGRDGYGRSLGGVQEPIVERRRATDVIAPAGTAATPPMPAFTRSFGLGTSKPAPDEAFIERLRRIQNGEPPELLVAPKPRGVSADVTDEDLDSSNDLRRYLQHRAARPVPERARMPRSRYDSSQQSPTGSIGLTLRTFDAVLNQVIAEHDRKPRGIIVFAPGSPKAATATSVIEVARMLASEQGRVLLVDLVAGSSAISHGLGLPRAPGIADLLAGTASFEDVVCVDPKTSLQVITSGNARAKGEGDQDERASRIFNALSQAYDLVLLHADQASLGKFHKPLEGRVALAIAVLATGGRGRGTLAEFMPLNCPVFPYEKTALDSNAGLLGRAAAI
jgi:uncharacterized protein involved in exopolysaccharide biosynthesis